MSCALPASSTFQYTNISRIAYSPFGSSGGARLRYSRPNLNQLHQPRCIRVMLRQVSPDAAHDIGVMPWATHHVGELFFRAVLRQDEFDGAIPEDLAHVVLVEIEQGERSCG